MAWHLLTHYNTVGTPARKTGRRPFNLYKYLHDIAEVRRCGGTSLSELDYPDQNHGVWHGEVLPGLAWFRLL